MKRLQELHPGVTLQPSKWWDAAMALDEKDPPTKGGPQKVVQKKGEKRKFEAFLIGPGGRSAKDPHLHLFLECAPRAAKVREVDHPIVIWDFHLTPRDGVHWKLDGNGGVVTKDTGDPVPSSTVSVDVLTQLCDMLNWARTDEGDVDEELRESPAKDSDVDELLGLASDCAAISVSFGVRPEVLKHFLPLTLGLDVDDVSALAGDAALFDTFAILADMKMLASLDGLAVRRGMSADTVIELLKNNPYPSSGADEVIAYFTGLIDGLPEPEPDLEPSENPKKKKSTRRNPKK
jgi:hypothetical protein